MTEPPDNNQSPKPGYRLSSWEIILVIAAGALSGYWEATHSGLFRILALVEVRWFGDYQGIVTVLACAVILAGPPLVAMRLVRWARRGRNGAGSGIAPTKQSVDVAGTPTPVGNPRPESWWRRDHRPSRAWALILPAVLGGVGAYSWFTVGGIHQCGSISAAQLESGAAPPSTWVNVRGMAFLEFAATISNDGAVTYYVPVTSDHWRRGQGIGVYLAIPEHDLDDELRKQTDGAFMGLIAAGGLPGPAEYELGKQGLGPAKGYYTVRYRQHPDDVRRIAVEMLQWAGIAAIVVGVFVLLPGRWCGLATNAPTPLTAQQTAVFRIKAIYTVPPSDKGSG